MAGNIHTCSNPHNIGSFISKIAFVLTFSELTGTTTIAFISLRFRGGALLGVLFLLDQGWTRVDGFNETSCGIVGSELP